MLGEHKPLHLASIAGAWLMYVIAVIFNILSTGPGQGTGIYLNKTTEIAAKFETGITPAGWTFSVWGVIYIWQALWLLYGTVNIFRRSQMAPMYIAPPIMPPALYIFFTINLAFNTAWTLLFDRQLIVWALVFIVFVPFTLYCALFVSYRQLDTYGIALFKQSKRLDIWLVRILVQNGLALYAAWVTIASLLGLAIVLMYRLNVSVDTASTICLSIVFVEVIVWFILDNSILDKYTRYTTTPYFIVILAATGILSKKWTPGNRNSIMLAVLLGIGIFCALAKIVIMTVRHIKRPFFQLTRGVTV